MSPRSLCPSPWGSVASSCLQHHVLQGVVLRIVVLVRRQVDVGVTAQHDDVFSPTPLRLDRLLAHLGERLEPLLVALLHHKKVAIHNSPELVIDEQRDCLPVMPRVVILDVVDEALVPIRVLDVAVLREVEPGGVVVVVGLGSEVVR